MINPTIFREYDIRGVVGDDLTPDVAAAIARAFSEWLERRSPSRRIVVGRDNRESSPRIAEVVIEALRASGWDVVDIGTVITPVFYYARVLLGIDGGVMITASHNPPQFNGFKLSHGFGTLYGEEIQDIGRLAMSAKNQESPTRGALEQADVIPAYRAMLREKIRLGPRRLRAVVDCGNGTAGPIAPVALADLGCDIIPLYAESDPTFPHHHPDPVQPKNLVDLIAAVKGERADVGIGLDGDGDRIGVVNDQGEILWGDILMILFWREILPKHPGTVGIVEVKCSQALYEEITRLGGRPMFYKTGHSLIKAKMKELGAVFTGEMSGHMFFADEYYGYDDAVYAAGRLLRILSNANRPLSGLLADVPRYHSTPEIRVDCPDDRKFEVVRGVTEAFRRRYEVIDVDGARVLFEQGWGLVRASNTQPALVLRAEARTPEGLKHIKREMEMTLEKFSGVGAIDW